MTHQPAAPIEADAPPLWVRPILHARIPAPLKLLLLALLAAFARAQAPRRTLHALRQDWLFSTNTDFRDDLESAHTAHALRRILQLRAEIGWLLRGRPNRGMALSGRRAPVPCPARAARAPPSSVHLPVPSRIRRQNPVSRGVDSRPSFGATRKEKRRPGDFT